MHRTALLLGVDGGGTKCGARLCAASGATLGEGLAGPANIRFDLRRSLAAVGDAAAQCLAQAGLARSQMRRITACLALAGATRVMAPAGAIWPDHPFGSAIVTTDAHAACIGAHGGGAGAIIIVGTGTVGWAVDEDAHARVGGWGFPVSDEGSGAWLGCEVLRRVLWAHDGRAVWTPVLRSLFERFQSDPHAISRWTTHALPRDFAALAPAVVDHAGQGDATAEALMRAAARHIDAMAGRLAARGTTRLSLLGGLATAIEPWLGQETRAHLVPPAGDALDGAIRLARAEAESMAGGER